MNPIIKALTAIKWLARADILAGIVVTLMLIIVLALRA